MGKVSIWERLVYTLSTMFEAAAYKMYLFSKRNAAKKKRNGMKPAEIEAEENKKLIHNCTLVESYAKSIVKLADLNIARATATELESIDRVNDQIEFTVLDIDKQRAGIERHIRHGVVTPDWIPAMKAAGNILTEYRFSLDIDCMSFEQYETAIDVIDNAVYDLDCWIDSIEKNKG